MLLYPVVYPFVVLRRYGREAQLANLLAAARGCQTYGEMQIVLGAPKYAIRGDRFKDERRENILIVPDIVQVYEVSHCVVEVWLSGDMIAAVTGYVRPTIWDLAAHSYTQRKSGNGDRSS